MEPPQSSYVNISALKNVSSDGDIDLLNMEFDIVEDIPAELEDFIFLSRLGLFQDARELFVQYLEPHIGFFPVLAEFADMLLEDGRYAELCQLLTDSYSENKFSEEERQLLGLMKALSEAYIEQNTNEEKEQSGDTKPKLKVALDRAQNWHRGWWNITQEFSGVEVGSFLIYLRLNTHMGRYKLWKSIFPS